MLEEPAQRDPILSANDILESLSRRVVGQNRAKKQLATLLAMHLAWFAEADMDHAAPNALLIGPTGVGKTHAIRTAAEALRVPLVVADGTRLASGGFQGTSLEDLLVELISAARKLLSDPVNPLRPADYGISELDELEVAKRGIVFIDEFDKLSTRKASTAERNELIQRRLLQFVDGASISLNPRPETGEEEVVFNTSGLLFVVGGAFTNLLADSSKRSQKQTREMSRHDYVVFEDLVRFGFMEELIARLPVLIEFDHLSEADLVEIMETPAVDPSLFYVRYLRSLGVELQISADAKQFIANRAYRLELGARGLHQVLFPILATIGADLEGVGETSMVLNAQDIKNLIDTVEGARRGR